MLIWNIIWRYTDVCHAHVNMIVLFSFVVDISGYVGLWSKIFPWPRRAALCVWPSGLPTVFLMFLCDGKWSNDSAVCLYTASWSCRWPCPRHLVVPYVLARCSDGWTRWWCATAPSNTPEVQLTAPSPQSFSVANCHWHAGQLSLPDTPSVLN
jgi:hypothetical protein